MEKTVAVVGSMNYDIILKVKRLPEEGETMAAESASISAGGKGANQAVQAAKLGVPTFMVGAVGRDHMGDFLLDEAEKYHLDTSHVKRSAEATGLGCVSALEDGRVFATINRGANYDLGEEDLENASAVLAAADVLILQNEIPNRINAGAIRRAKAGRARVLYNAAPAVEEGRELLPLADIVIVNEVEASFYLGTALKDPEAAAREGLRVSNEMKNTWIITMGSMGSVICSGGRSELVKPYKVDAVETTGAGDSYIGGLSYALLEGMDVFEAASFATKCSAITVCGIGAQPSMPVLADIFNKFEKN